MSSPDITQEQAVSLLDKLGTDDAFRATFASDPAKALESLGIDSTDKTLLCCSGIQALASKEEIRSALKKLLSYLGGVHHFEDPGVFEAGNVEAALKDIQG